MINVYNNIYRIKSHSNTHGCGFIIGKYFITAGHVIANSKDPFIEIEGKIIRLENPLFCNVEKEDSGYDLAIYELEEVIFSPLKLLSVLPTSGTTFNNYHIKEVVEEFGFFNYVPEECNAIVGDTFGGNYYSVLTSINLKSGCSGSPVLMGDNVAGIIVAGNNNGDGTCKNKNFPLNFCLVLSSKSIYNLIKERILPREEIKSPIELTLQ